MNLSLVSRFLMASLLAGSAHSQLRFSEVLRNEQSSFSPQFIEIQGAPSASLDGVAIVALEAENLGFSSDIGVISDVYDLSGLDTRPNGFFVVGDSAVSPDLTIAPADIIFPGRSLTFYLLAEADIAGLQAAVGSSLLVSGTDSSTIGSFGLVQDLVGVDFAGIVPVFLDGAIVLDFNQGAFRSGDDIGNWCASEFLDSVSPSPGASNPTCVDQVTAGVNFCQSLPNSSGNAATISGSGSLQLSASVFSLAAEGLPTSTVGIFFFGTNQVNVPFGDGIRCIGGTIQRLPINSSNANGVMVQPNIFSTPAGTQIGAMTLNFQGWFRDPAAMGTGFNLSNGLQATFSL